MGAESLTILVSQRGIGVAADNCQSARVLLAVDATGRVFRVPCPVRSSCSPFQPCGSCSRRVCHHVSPVAVAIVAVGDDDADACNDADDTGDESGVGALAGVTTISIATPLFTSHQIVVDPADHGLVRLRRV